MLFSSELLRFQRLGAILGAKEIIMEQRNGMPYIYEEIKQNMLLAHRTGEQYRNIFHRHNGYEIYLLLQGDINMLVEHSCVHIGRGALAIMNPTEYHLAVSMDGGLYERYTLNLTTRFLQSLTTDQTNFISFFDKRNPGQNNIVTLAEDDIHTLQGLFDSLKSALDSDVFCSDILANSYCMQVLYFVCRKFIESENIPANIMPPIITRTIQYINDHITESITLTDIGNELSYNKDYIGKIFRQYTGIPLKTYILEKKMDLAQSLLAQGQSVTETCFNTGFQDYANFIRTFKKYTGHTPNKGRRENGDIPPWKR